MFIYLALNLFTISIPLSRSFEEKIGYYKMFKSLFTAIAVTASIFLTWDYFFTRWNIWSFNPDFLIGIYFLGMPVEEWLFFFTIPYACIFIYETLKYFSDLKRFNLASYGLTVLLIIILTIVGGLNIDRLYTAVTFLSTAVFLLFILVWRPDFLATFYVSYIICIVPFFLINGLLTCLPVVSYNDAENLAIRIFSVPIEDTVYMLLLLIMNVSIFEFLKSRWNKNETRI